MSFQSLIHLLRGVIDRLLGWFQRKPDPRQQFAERLLARIQNAAPERHVTYNPTEFSFRDSGEDSPHVMFLHNAFVEYLHHDEQVREEIVTRWARHFLSEKGVPDEFDDAKHDLLPALRARSFYEFLPHRSFGLKPVEISRMHSGTDQRIRGPAVAEGHRPYRLRYTPDQMVRFHFSYEIIAEYYAVGLSYDMYDSIAMISAKHLEDWGITFYEAMEVAKRNLEEKGCRFEVAELEETEFGPMRLYSVAVGDGYDATRLLMTDMFCDLQLRGDPIAVALTNDLLLVTGSDDVAALMIMLTRAQKIGEMSHPLAPIFLRLVGGHWEHWLPPEEHLLYRPIKKLFLEFCAADYEEQKYLITSSREEAGITICPFLYIDNERLDSLCILRPGRRQLIPKTDSVGFEYSEEHRVILTWDDAIEKLGESVRETDDYPARFLVEELPPP